jgi:hypothetical protein
MGLMTKSYEENEKRVKKERAEMEKRNQEHMDNLAKQVPTPTLEEIQASLLGKAVEKKNDEKKTDSKKEEAKKEVEAKPHSEKEGYVTRETKTKDK